MIQDIVAHGNGSIVELDLISPLHDVTSITLVDWEVNTATLLNEKNSMINVIGLQNQRRHQQHISIESSSNPESLQTLLDSLESDLFSSILHETDTNSILLTCTQSLTSLQWNIHGTLAHAFGSTSQSDIVNLQFHKQDEVTWSLSMHVQPNVVPARHACLSLSVDELDIHQTQVQKRLFFAHIDTMNSTNTRVQQPMWVGKLPTVRHMVLQVNHPYSVNHLYNPTGGRSMFHLRIQAS